MRQTITDILMGIVYVLGIFGNIIVVGYLLFLWSHDSTFAQAAWSAFLLMVSFIAVIFALIITAAFISP